MKAVIMAGGFGTRIQPLTSSLPKPMIPLLNRPIMLHIVELLKSYGITDLVMLLYHQPLCIKNFFRDGSEFGVKITYVTPLTDMGTAGAVKAAEKFLDERFIIISGDLLTDFNLEKIIRFHEEKKAAATITLTSVKDPLQFGVVITDKEKRIVQFLEKPGWGEVISDTINTGIYVLEPEVLQYIPPEENFDFSQDLFPLLLERKEPLFGVTVKGYWRDIGNTDSYREAHHDIFKGRVTLKTDEVRRDFPGKDIRTGADVRIDDPGRFAGMVIISDNSQVTGHPHIKDSVIGRNCTIEDGAVLSRCIIWDNAYIKSGTKISDSVICNNVRVGQGVVIEEGVIVAEDTSIGEGAFIKQDVKIWPRKLIDAGAQVTANLIWGEKWKKSLFEGAMVKGLTNIELTPEFVAKMGCAYGTSIGKGSFVLAGRDASLSSRMLKRSFLGGILSAGVNVRDLKMMPLPLIRYKLNTYGEVGGVYFRQSIDDPAVTEMLFLDGDGLDFSSAMTKNIERIFFKENFRRVHHSEPGGITELPQVIDFYREGFLRTIDRNLLQKRNMKIVIDFNSSPSGQILPALLNELGCEVIGLNGFVDKKLSTGNAEEKSGGLQQLSKIVTTLEAEAGFWLDPDGEQITLVDNAGKIYEPAELLALVVTLLLRSGERGSIAIPVSAPSIIEQIALEKRCQVTRTKSTERAMIEAALSSETIMVGSMSGQFSFSRFQPAFDGMFAVAKIMELVAATDLTLAKAAAGITRKTFLQSRIPCAWELKGGVMRKMSEDSLDKEATFVDGIKVHDGEDWLLLLPDQYKPFIHLVAESEDPKAAEQLIDDYRRKVEEWKQELQ
jgi:mannose-1-phosphate guanylyltransferase/phosphomannomutase